MAKATYERKDWMSLAAIFLAFFFGAAYGIGAASAQTNCLPNAHDWTLVIYDYGGPWEGDFQASPGGEANIISSQVVFINNSETVEAVVFITEPSKGYAPRQISLMLIDNDDGALVATARGTGSVYLFYGGGRIISGDASVML